MSIENEDLQYSQKHKLIGWDSDQICEHKFAVKRGLDISNLDPDIWSSRHMRQQILALDEGLDLSNLDPTIWHFDYMEQYRIALSKGFDISNLDPNCWYDVELMKLYVNELIRGIDLSEVVNNDTIESYSYNELNQLICVTKSLWGKIYRIKIPVVEIDRLLKLYWSKNQIAEQGKAISEGFDISNLDPSKWSWNKMSRQRLALKYGFDFSKLDNWTYDMLTIQFNALRQGIDLSKLDDIDTYLLKDRHGYALNCLLDKMLEERGDTTLS